MPPKTDYIGPAAFSARWGFFIVELVVGRETGEKRSAAEAEYDRLAALAWSPRPLKSARSFNGSPQGPRWFIHPLAAAAPDGCGR